MAKALGFEVFIYDFYIFVIFSTKHLCTRIDENRKSQISDRKLLILFLQKNK